MSQVEPQASPIAIVGLGALFPGAPDVSTYWHNIVRGVDATSEVPPDRWGPEFYDTHTTRSDRFYCRRGGFISEPRFDALSFGVMPVAVDDAEPDQLLALQVAQAAIDDAGGFEGRVDPERVGVVLGRGGYLTAGMARLDQRVRGVNQALSVLKSVLPDLPTEHLALVEKAFREQLGPERPEAAIGLVPNLAASRIANRLDLRGPAFTIDAACASSLLAVEQSVHALRSGRCDVMLAGGVHHCHDITFWSVFAQLGALSRAQRIRPFDQAADGLLIGEGTGVVVLKRLADAEADGDRVYAVIKGVGSSSDGRASSLMKPRVSGQVLALTRAWADAALDPATVGLVEAHGTATPAGDEAELATMTQVFGPADQRPRAGLGSVKSMIGHTMPAAGVAGLIKAALAVFHQTLPPSIGCDDPHSAIDKTRFRVIQESEAWERGPDRRRAAINAFGFGGINAHVVIEEWSGNEQSSSAGQARGRVSVSSRPIAPLLIAGNTVADVAAQLDRPDVALLAPSFFEVPVGSVRFALTEPTHERLALARKVVERGRPWRGRSDLWFTAEPLLGVGGGRVAFCHPGVEPSFEPRLDDVTDLFEMPRLDVGDGTVTHRARAIVNLGRTLHRVLLQVGIEPDLELGHSVGEWTAMSTTGHVPPDEVDGFIARLDMDALTVPDAWYVALGCPAEDAYELIDGLANAALTHDNCPHQSMVCADEAGADQVLDRARGRRIMAQKLPFRSGFHSPLLAPHLAPFERSLRDLPLATPHTQLWSATTGEPYPHEGTATRALALRHLVEPVRFTRLVRRLFQQERVRAVIQVGTGSTTGFVDDILRGEEVLTITANDPKRSGLAQLTRVMAAVWVEGLSPRWDALVPATSNQKSVALRLGAPLLTLDPAVALAPRTEAGPSAVATGELPGSLGRALAGVMAEIGTASNDVARAMQHAHVPAATERTIAVSSKAMEWVSDHCFYRQADGWPHEADRFPVVPMTTMVEMMAAEAEWANPGRVVVAMTRVQALKWLAASPATEVTLRTAPISDHPDHVKVGIDGHARAIAVLADRYLDPPAACFEPLQDPRPSERSAAAMYSEKMMFHGPAFQGVTELSTLGSDGIDGELVSLPTPGALLDSAGQVMGYWMMVSTETDRLALPVSIGELAFFGPMPEVGTPVSAKVRVTQLTPKLIEADHELCVDGKLWCRITAWQDRRFQSDDMLWPLFTRPESSLLNEVQPGGWNLVRERWPDAATRELVLRRYTTATERAVHDKLTPREQRTWLLGRVAAKDSIRQALGIGPDNTMFPAEVGIVNDEAGRPVATVPTGRPPQQVSIAHLDGVGVALARPGGGEDPDPCGIDITAVEHHAHDGLDHVAALALTESERNMISPGPERAEDIARLWAVKEAAGKALGTGLAGRPRAITVSAVDGSVHRVDIPVETTASTRTLWIDTVTIEMDLRRYVVAWTTSTPNGENQ